MIFYLAGPYSKRKDLSLSAHVICRISTWRCNARWLAGSHDGMDPKRAAIEDVDDVRTADALVIDARQQSTRGGMWVEAGIAIADGKPVVLIVSPSQCPNVFMSLAGTYWVGDEFEAGGLLTILAHRHMKGRPDDA